MVQIMGSARAYSHKSLMFPDRLTRKVLRSQTIFEGAIQLSYVKFLILQAESLGEKLEKVVPLNVAAHLGWPQ